MKAGTINQNTSYHKISNEGQYVSLDTEEDVVLIKFHYL